MKYPYSLLDFKNEQSFLEFQNKFKSFDNSSKIKSEDFTKIKEEDFTIKFFDLSERISDNTSKVYSISFYEFLKMRIDSLAKEYIDEIESQFEKRNLFNKELKKAYVDSEINKLHKIEKQIMDFIFLPKEIMELLMNQVQNTVEFLSNNYIPVIESENKLNFNLNKTDLIHFFYLLRQNKIIDFKYSDGELGKLLDRYFSYKDDRNDKYESVTLSRAMLNKIKNINVTTEKSFKRLKVTFCNDDFYLTK